MSSIRGEADLELGALCNETRNGENDFIKVCTKKNNNNKQKEKLLARSTTNISIPFLTSGLNYFFTAKLRHRSPVLGILG